MEANCAASNITDDPEYWQKRAEEARTLAAQMMDTHQVAHAWYRGKLRQNR
jgi:hypothetical protein